MMSASFIPQGNHRIELGGTSRREEPCDGCHGREHDYRDTERQGIAGPKAKELTADKPDRAERGRHADDEADGCKDQRIAQDQPEHVPPFGPVSSPMCFMASSTKRA